MSLESHSGGGAGLVPCGRLRFIGRNRVDRSPLGSEVRLLRVVAGYPRFRFRSRASILRRIHAGLCPRCDRLSTSPRNSTSYGSWLRTSTFRPRVRFRDLRCCSGRNHGQEVTKTRAHHRLIGRVSWRHLDKPLPPAVGLNCPNLGDSGVCCGFSE